MGSQPGQASLMVDRTEKADGIVEIDNGPDTPNKPTPQEVLFSFQSMPYVTPEEYRNLIDEEMVGLGKTVDDLTTGMKKQQATLRGESGSK